MRRLRNTCFQSDPLARLQPHPYYATLSTPTHRSTPDAPDTRCRTSIGRIAGASEFTEWPTQRASTAEIDEFGAGGKRESVLDETNSNSPHYLTHRLMLTRSLTLAQP